MMATFVLMDRDSRKVHAVEPEIVAPYQSDFDKNLSVDRSMSPWKNRSARITMFVLRLGYEWSCQ